MRKLRYPIAMFVTTVLAVIAIGVVIMVLAMATLTKAHLVAGRTVAGTPRNGRSARCAEPAAPRWSDLPGPGGDFLERVGADLLIVGGPVGTRCHADGPARRAVQGQGRRSWWPLAVQDVPVWMPS